MLRVRAHLEAARGVLERRVVPQAVMPVTAELFRDAPVRESELRQDRDCHVRAQLVQRVLRAAANRPEVQHSTASDSLPESE